MTYRTRRRIAIAAYIVVGLLFAAALGSVFFTHGGR